MIFEKSMLYCFRKEWTEMKKSTLAVERCKTVSAIQKILGGKWKIEIIYYIAFRDIHRFGELRRQIGDITDKAASGTGSGRLHYPP